MSKAKTIPILPGTILKVYDDTVGSYMPAIVVRRYGYISRFMLREYGLEASRYPDNIDVVFAHSPGFISPRHFTPLNLISLNQGCV